MALEYTKATASTPGFATIPVFDGSESAKVRRWTMAERAELKPKVAALMKRLGEAAEGGIFGLAELFTAAESEVFEVVKASTTLGDGVSFDQLPWAELPDLAQAVWEVNIITEAGGGLAGKLASLVGPMLGQAVALKSAGLAAAKHSAKTQPNGQRPPASPSLPDAGDPTSNGSGTASPTNSS